MVEVREKNKINQEIRLIKETKNIFDNGIALVSWALKCEKIDNSNTHKQIQEKWGHPINICSCITVRILIAIYINLHDATIQDN